MKQITNAPNAPAPVGAYSQAIQTGSLLFCSGQIGLSVETGALVHGGVEEEARQVLRNINAVLEHAGVTSGQIVMSSIFLIAMEDFGAVNKIYSEFVSAACPPARQTVAVKELPLGAKVEISVIAELI